MSNKSSVRQAWQQYNFRESEITIRRVQKILKAGATVVLTTGGIDDMCLKEFTEVGAMGVRRCKKEDLKRIAKATGGEFTALTLLFYSSNFNGQSFQPP